MSGGGSSMGHVDLNVKERVLMWGDANSKGHVSSDMLTGVPKPPYHHPDTSGSKPPYHHPDTSVSKPPYHHPDTSVTKPPYHHPDVQGYESTKNDSGTHTHHTCGNSGTTSSTISGIVHCAGGGDENIDQLFVILGDILGELRQLTEKSRVDMEHDDICNDWKFAAMVVDRLCLIVFTLLTIGSTFGILFSASHIIA